MIAAARVWLPDSASTPGKLEEVELDVERVEPHALVLPEVTVRHAGAEVLFEGTDLRFDPRDGGGPGADPAKRREARCFGVVNAAFHLQRGLRRISRLLGRPLPPLTVRTGAHSDRLPPWGGGHYRLPAAAYDTLPETDPVATTGEIHLGPGRTTVSLRGRRYWHDPAHDPAIVCHELGHHLTRHTADFRLNRRRPLQRQANRKIPLDEGTSDYLAATLLGTPDIYGWHRAGVPPTSLRRRRLDGPWTMACFVGGNLSDPHADGAIWSAALWATRCALEEQAVDPEQFDRLVVRGLDRLGSGEQDLSIEEARPRRRHYGRLLGAILEEDAERDGGLGGTIEAVFAGRGIRIGPDNQELRDGARIGVAAPLALAR
jgi:hypothetical protein